MLYRYKAQFQNFSQRLVGNSMSANMASGLGLFFVFLTVLVVFYSKTHPYLLLLSPLLILFRFIMNAMDGLIARAKNTASPLGELLNEFFDVAGDLISYSSLVWIFSGITLELIFLMNAIWLCEFMGVLGKVLPNGRRRQESILGGKPERAVWLGLIFIGKFLDPSWMNQNIQILLRLIVFVVILSGFKRMLVAVRNARNHTYRSDPLIGR
jgi:phosphatidylglycerophosphate synthase